MKTTENSYMKDAATIGYRAALCAVSGNPTYQERAPQLAIEAAHCALIAMTLERWGEPTK